MSIITPSFECDSADIDETAAEADNPQRLVEKLAEKKAAAVLRRRPRDVVIGADTVVALGNEIFGKPADGAEAERMLRGLSGREHSVWTGVCILSGNIREVFSARTAVEFLPLSDGQIREYVKSGEPFDKAGAYGIQGAAALFIAGISGDYYNVMGLPVSLLNTRLRGLRLLDFP